MNWAKIGSTALIGAVLCAVALVGAFLAGVVLEFFAWTLTGNHGIAHPLPAQILGAVAAVVWQIRKLR